MMYATAGNLDTYLLNRSNSPNPGVADLSAGNIADAESLGQLPKEERIKAFKKRRQSSSAGTAGAGPRRKREENRAVLMLGLEEIGKLFGDVVEGLAFLVSTRLCIPIVHSLSDRSPPACQFYPSFGSQVLECVAALGGRKAHVSEAVTRSFFVLRQGGRD